MASFRKMDSANSCSNERQVVRITCGFTLFVFRFISVGAVATPFNYFACNYGRSTVFYTRL